VYHGLTYDRISSHSDPINSLSTNPCGVTWKLAKGIKYAVHQSPDANCADLDPCDSHRSERESGVSCIFPHVFQGASSHECLAALSLCAPPAPSLSNGFRRCWLPPYNSKLAVITTQQSSMHASRGRVLSSSS
jgi:hypothetical protein